MTLSHQNELVAMSELPPVENKYVFVGLDLAPIDSLETGVVVVDRNRKIMRMEKMEQDSEILGFLETLGPKDSLIIALDIPKSLSFTSKWRQQQIRMHPLRMLNNDDASGSNRFAKRADDIYHRLVNKGFFVVNYFSHYAKLRYHLNVPYRSRSPHGCRALQAMIKERLKISHTSNNLAPSSVLDAMIGAYIAWNIYAFKMQQTKYEIRTEREQSLTTGPFSHKLTLRKFQRPTPKLGKQEQPFQFYRDKDRRLFFEPLKLFNLVADRRMRVRF